MARIPGQRKPDESDTLKKSLFFVYPEISEAIKKGSYQPRRAGGLEAVKFTVKGNKL